MGLYIFKNLEGTLMGSFRRLGHIITQHTGYFMVIPPLIAIIMATGFQRMVYIKDSEYLYSPVNGPARIERELAGQYFKENFSDFDPGTIITRGRFANLIITAKDEGNVLTQEVWDEVILLDKWVKNLSIEEYGIKFRFTDLCALKDASCIPNKVLNMYSLIPEIVNGSFKVIHPITLNPDNFEVYFLSIYFGGFSFYEDGSVEEIKAIQLTYWLKSGNKRDDKRSGNWEKLLLEGLEKDNYTYITVDRFTSITDADELDVNMMSVLPLSFPVILIVITFSMAALSMSDCVQAKPYLGVMGVISVGLALMTSYGFLMYLGVPFIGINLASPFLMLGIGVDDMFVLLAAWRRTSVQDSVEKRMGETFSEAAVSITITTLTDTISFFIGIMTPFPSVRIFCIYAGAGILVTYVFQLTFFGACMAIDGRREHLQKHALFFTQIKSKSETEKVSGRCSTFWCAGGLNPEDPINPKDQKDQIIPFFLRDTLARVLSMPLIKGGIIVAFFIYLGGAIYGCITVKEGLEPNRLYQYDSYAKDYFNVKDKYFRDHPYRIQVIITGDINYSNDSTKEHLLDLHKKIEDLPYIAKRMYTTSWIRRWYRFLDWNGARRGINITDEKEFIYHLRNIYLVDNPDKKADIKFNEDFSKIVASRFLVQSDNIPDFNADAVMMLALRKVAKESPLNVTVHNAEFILFDQFVMIRQVCIQAVSIATVVMLVILLVFIPNLKCCLCVAFSIISIEVGVVGYMAHWGVNLDCISMINLIMCIGFSVDFSAHISYAYLTAKVDTPKKRIEECMYKLGLPVLQGAISTVLGVCLLMFMSSYIFVTFAKTVFLVMVFGVAHSLLLLPVLLSIIGSLGNSKPKESVELEDTKNGKIDSNKITEYCEVEEDLKEGSIGTEEDKDMGIGTSEEESSVGSLSKVAGIQHLRNLPKASNNIVMQSYNNEAFIDDEKLYYSEEVNDHSQTISETKTDPRHIKPKVYRKQRRQRKASDSSDSSQ